jgi:hypothetical protein
MKASGLSTERVLHLSLHAAVGERIRHVTARFEVTG